VFEIAPEDQQDEYKDDGRGYKGYNLAFMVSPF
jgi:hypothetical protein